jgi:multidrug efflux pump subunit AcrB
VLAEARRHPDISAPFTAFRASVPQLQLDVDRPRTLALGVPLGDVFRTLQTYLAGFYVNDVTLFGRNYRVTVQADSQFRASAGDVGRFFVRSGSGQMIPLDTLTTAQRIAGPDALKRYNVYPAVEITGAAAQGRSSGQAMSALEEIAARVLPAGYGYEWTALSYQELRSRGQAPVLLGLAVLFVFLLLAALYESWSVPLAVVLVVPCGIFGALLATWLRGLQSDVYAQIGLVMVVGLSAKNAVLIVEFAKVRRQAGGVASEAAREAARIRFRPILMTSLAFILGVLPLVLASGAGSGARRALGTSVFGGMIAATTLGVLFVPAFFVLIEEWLVRRGREPATPDG